MAPAKQKFLLPAILLANDIIEPDSEQFTSELATITDYVILTGLDDADERALEQQRDSIIAHLLSGVE